VAKKADDETQPLIEKRELHGLVLHVTDTLQAATLHTVAAFRHRFFATVSVVGSRLAWRNLATSSDLQIRLVRASELNTHLKEMNLARRAGA